MKNSGGNLFLNRVLGGGEGARKRGVEEEINARIITQEGIQGGGAGGDCSTG